MKPYFTKYRPVEGEIKEGAIWRMSSTYNDGKNGFYIKLGKETIHNAEHDDRTFTVEVLNPEIIGKNVNDGKVHLPKSYHPSHFKQRSCYPVKLFLCSRDNKLIGEVNPKAKWVKENDEFDETQILMVDNYPFVIGKYVSLKCPCCEEWK